MKVTDETLMNINVPLKICRLGNKAFGYNQTYLLSCPNLIWTKETIQRQEKNDRLSTNFQRKNFCHSLKNMKKKEAKSLIFQLRRV